MSVVAIHPRTYSPAGPSRAGSSRRRPSSAKDVPVLRVTLDVPLVGERLTPELSLLLDLVRDLVDRGVGVTAVTAVAARPTSAAPVGAEPAHAGPLPTPPAGDVDPGGGPGDQPAGAGTDDARTLRVLTGPRVVLRGGSPVPFTRLEFDLLVFLARHPRRVFTRLQLLSNVWGYEHAVARTVDVHVRRVRAKVGDGVPLVTTVHGVGYRLADDAPIRLDDGDDGDGDGWGPGVSLL
ncbi:winged helix-turn-helix domain-containing protein [Plantactinospora solaniradicis]|uniref:Winged helix-turn-helix domain-containing protein n=1 Tax=Plantactinospora solaniradicis TaxID=1723736 RepID=A0ABW1KNW4_9ACTN